MRAADRTRGIAIVASAWLLAGCICRGPGAGTDCPLDDAGASSPAAAAQAVFTRACVSCHPGEGQEPDFSSAAMLATLVNTHPPMCPSNPDPFIAPGDPDHSYIIDKVTQASGICGARMPFGGAALSAADIATLRTWIASLGADAGTTTDAAMSADP